MTELFPTMQPEAEPSIDESSSLEEIAAAVQYFFDQFHTRALTGDWDGADKAILLAQQANSFRYGERNLPSLVDEVGVIRRQAQVKLARGEYVEARWNIRSLGYPLAEYECGEEGAIVDLLRNIAEAGLANDSIVDSPIVQQTLRLIR